MPDDFVQLVGPNRVVQISGVKLLGFDAVNAHKLIFTIVLFLFLYVISKGLRSIARRVGGSRQKTAFWARQGISLVTFLFGLVGFVSIWSDNPARLVTGAGLLGAGL